MEATWACQTWSPVFWSTATSEPSCWPTKTLPSPRAISRDAMVDDQSPNAGLNGALPTKFHLLFPEAASSAETPLGVATYITPLDTIGLVSMPCDPCGPMFAALKSCCVHATFSFPTFDVLIWLSDE